MVTLVDSLAFLASTSAKSVVMSLSRSQTPPWFSHAILNLGTLDIMTGIRRLPYCLESIHTPNLS